MQTADIPKCIQLDHEGGSCGIVFEPDAEHKCSFPYNAYQWAEGMATEITIRFNTHRVIIRGQHLESLPEQLALQKVRWVKVAGRAAGMLSTALNGNAPIVDEITIEKTRE